jgi:hypothetical protein
MSSDDFAHVRWLGGSACAGKSNAARALAAAHGLTYYSCDEQFEAHRRRASRDRHPHFCRLMDLPAEELWAPPVDDRVRDLLAFYEDELTLILEDLRELTGPVIAEGVGLLPARVAAVLADPRHACWLIATPAFRRRHYPQRTAMAELLGRSPDPQVDFETWMARDDEVARRLEAEAAAHALPIFLVNGTVSKPETAAALARQLGLQPV